MAESTGTCRCGATGWRLRGRITSATICNCTLCRRYGVLWAYGFDGEDIAVTAPEGGLHSYIVPGGTLTMDRCATCGALVRWRSMAPAGTAAASTCGWQSPRRWPTSRCATYTGWTPSPTGRTTAAGCGTCGPDAGPQAAATRQTTLPTSSATSRLRPSGPTATPTGRP